MMVAHSQALLVPAKLMPPQPLATWVSRKRLLTCLDSAASTRLTLVVAPAGFGKSTLVAQWLLASQQGCAGAYAERAIGAPTPVRAAPPPAVAWLTLDEHDQDDLRFLAYVAGAITRVLPEALPTTLELLAAAAPPPAPTVLQALLVELSALACGLTLVLDDYHTVTAEPVHKAVAYLLRHLPPQCRLVLLSRMDPPLPLARLRAEQQVTEVRAADLRFTPAETGTLLAHLIGNTPDAAHVAALQEQTEGWVIALQLAALARLETRTPQYSSGAASRQIAEYLGDEVFAQQSDEIQRVLLALAVPERFCAGLGAALLGTPGQLFRAESLLDQLVRANLFVIALDEEGAWYRFHHLFRDLLLRRLRLTASPEVVRELDRRAAHWLADEGLVEEAVRHFLAAGEEQAAADLVEHLLLPEMDNDVAAAPPGYWLRLLPAELVARRPGLALLVARLSVFSMDMGQFETSLTRLDRLLAAPSAADAPAPWPSFQADLTVLRGILCYWQGRPADTITYMRAALTQGPTTALAFQALLQLGLSYVGNGAYGEGVRMIETGLPAIAGKPGERDLLYQCSCLANMHQLAGELAAQAQAARRLAEEVVAHGCGDLWVGYAASSLGLVAYERSDLAAAATHFSVLAGRKYRVSYPGYMGGVIGLALVAAAQGAFAEAAPLVQEAQAFADEAGGMFLRHQALGCAVRVALAMGDREAALRAAAGIAPDLRLGLSLSLETPRLSQVRALIAADEPPLLARADALLDDCLAEIAPLHHTRLLIAALALQSLLRQAQGRADEALASLRQAVTLAEPRGFLRTFVDLGPGLAPLLRTLAARGSTAYLEQLLAAFGPALPARPQLPQPAQPELLTRRELEILALLAERWSDKEIAERLVIAPNTVRKHTSTIYDKLGVGSRREAVDTARTLGLLPSL